MRATDNASNESSAEDGLYDVEAIVDIRAPKDLSGALQPQYLVKWEGYADDGNTWEYWSETLAPFIQAYYDDFRAAGRHGGTA